jgi:hypothetical protein
VISSVEEFLSLQSSSDLKQRHRAWSDAAPEEVWLEIIERRPEMRAAVAYNSTIPETVVRRLAADDGAEVRLVIARRKRLPESIFDVLSRDPDRAVREAIAWNPWTPATIRTRLASDPDHGVSQMAKEVAARHEEAAVLRRSIPPIPGLVIDRSDPGRAGVVVGDDATSMSFRTLVSWLPEDCSLHFWDAEYPSPSDPGAYFVVQKSAGKIFWTMGNHGWSGDWRATSADEVVARLAANRSDERGGPARIQIQKAWPVRDPRGGAEFKAERAGEPFRARGATGREGVASGAGASTRRPHSRWALWGLALVATILALWGAAIIAANFGVDFSLPRFG